MFSGKDFNGGTIGIAWVGVICNAASLSYGVASRSDPFVSGSGLR
jgi:hypothetical protein